MGLIAGVFKFVVGVVLGAATGATIATLIVTRDPNKTLARLQGVMEDVVQGGKQAAALEEARQAEIRAQYIGEATQARLLKAAEKKDDKDKDKKKK